GGGSGGVSRGAAFGGGNGDEEDAAMLAVGADRHHHPGAWASDEYQHRFWRLPMMTHLTGALGEMASERFFTSLHVYFPHNGGRAWATDEAASPPGQPRSLARLPLAASKTQYAAARALRRGSLGVSLCRNRRGYLVR